MPLMVCWRGACRIGRQLYSNDSSDLTLAEAGRADPALVPSLLAPAGGTPQRKNKDPVEMTWAIPPPSPSYAIVDQLRKKQRSSMAGKQKPALVQEQLQEMRALVVQYEKQERDEQARRAERARRPKAGPELTLERRPFVFIATEGGSGYRKPKPGDTVRVSYAVAVDDGSVVDLCPERTLRLLGTDGVEGDAFHPGRVTTKAIQEAVVQMKREQVASMSCTLSDLFTADAPVVKSLGGEARAAFEVRLLEIFHSNDCSFQKNAREVVKEVIKEGVGEWCDNPTDAGFAEIEISEVWDSAGKRLLPTGKGKPVLKVQVIPGDGEVCDALECAMLQMKRHEIAVVTAQEPSFVLGGFPFINQDEAPILKGPISIKVALLDYHKGPDVWKFDEAARLEFASKRKVVANRLFGEMRFRLARERYQQAIDLFSHMDIPKARDRFLGQAEVLAECKALRVACRLNIAACSINLKDATTAKIACDSVLAEQPENRKALYRRARAHMLMNEHEEACRDLRFLLDVESVCPEAALLLKQADKMRRQADRQQQQQQQQLPGDGPGGAYSSLRFHRMISGIDDIRSESPANYLDADWDAGPEVEGTPVSARKKNAASFHGRVL